MKKILLSTTVLFLLACASKPKTDVPVNTPAPQGTLQGQGTVHRAIFSHDGARLFTLVSGVPETKGAQIYETELATKTEKRVTWQDGDIESFDVGPGDSLAYASTTDELKERPHSSERPAEQGDPMEVYTSDRFGEAIRRATHRPGYDGHVSLSPKGDVVVFVSKLKNRWTLQRLKIGGAAEVIANKGSGKRLFPSIGNNGKVAWIETSAQGNTALRSENRRDALRREIQNPAGLRHLPGGGWLTWTRARTVSYLFLMTEDFGCQRSLWEGPGELAWADFSPQAKKLALVVKDGKESKFFINDVAEFGCPPPPPPRSGR